MTYKPSGAKFWDDEANRLTGPKDFGGFRGKGYKACCHDGDETVAIGPVQFHPCKATEAGNAAARFKAGLIIACGVELIIEPPLRLPTGWEVLAPYAQRYIPPIIRVAWQDYDAPRLLPEAWAVLWREIKARAFEHVVVCCFGAHGRTGTALASLHLAEHPGDPSEEAIRAIRRAYCDQAVECLEQREYLAEVASAMAQDAGVPLRSYVPPPSGKTATHSTVITSPPGASEKCAQCGLALFLHETMHGAVCPRCKHKYGSPVTAPWTPLTAAADADADADNLKTLLLAQDAARADEDEDEDEDEDAEHCLAGVAAHCAACGLILLERETRPRAPCPRCKHKYGLPVADEDAGLQAYRDWMLEQSTDPDNTEVCQWCGSDIDPDADEPCRHCHRFYHRARNSRGRWRRK